jgi:hypothetical protein
LLACLMTSSISLICGINLLSPIIETLIFLYYRTSICLSIKSFIGDYFLNLATPLGLSYH